MIRRQNPWSRTDLELLYEALLYLRKRVFQPADAVRLQGLLDRVEEMILRSAEDELSLRLSPPEQEVLRREAPRYYEALTQRGGSAEGARSAARLRSLLDALAPEPGLKGWWTRRFRR